MCGIVGLVNLDKSAVGAEKIEPMLNAISHRGPDYNSHFCIENIGIGHHRLSIIDTTSRSHQPMSIGEDLFWITYNGEVFNFKEIRSNLPDSINYQSNSDTEVILQAYKHYGMDCLSMFNGMFAFAILDLSTNKLIIVRDRFGIKPLYFSSSDSQFIFASEVNALMAVNVSPNLNYIGMFDYVQSGWTSDHNTLFESIERIPPGHYLSFDLSTNEYQMTHYYSPKPLKLPSRKNSRSLLNKLQHTLEDSVRARLISDVPVGTFCSGGLDSSLITAIATRESPSIKAFTVSHADVPIHDELPYAKDVCKYLNIPLVKLSMTKEKFRDSLVSTIYHAGSPLTQINTVSLRLLSKLIRESGIKVMLSGEGADELFGGYVYQYRKEAVKYLSANLPFPANSISKLIIRVLQKSGAVISDPVSMKSHPNPAEVLSSSGLRYWNYYNDASLPKDFSTDEKHVYNALYAQLHTYLPHILERTDIATMSESIECRVPFLDYRVVELALSLPINLKLRTNLLRVKSKFCLKEISYKYLPSRIINRKKVGFHTPSTYYLGQWPSKWLKEGFITSHCRLKKEIFKSYLETLTDKSNQYAFTLLSLEIWGQIFIMKNSVDQVKDELFSMYN